MTNSFCVTLLVLISAFLHVTHVTSYSQSYDSSAGRGSPSYDSSAGRGSPSYDSSAGRGSPSYDSSAGRGSPSYDSSAGRGSPSYDSSAGRGSPSYDSSAGRGSPSYDSSAGRGSPSYDSSAGRGSPSYDSSAGRGSPSYDSSAGRGSPSYDSSAGRGSPSYDSSAGRGSPSYDSSAGRGSPSYDSSAGRGSPSYDSSAGRGSPSYDSSAGRGSPSYDSSAGRGSPSYDSSAGRGSPSYDSSAGRGSPSYDSSAGRGSPDSSASYLTNFGNGHNKRNFLKIDETAYRTSVSGISFSNNESGRPSAHKINVDINNPDPRGGPQGHDVNLNPKAPRTQVSNIGNGIGNKNLFIFNDDRHSQPNPGNNQGGYQGRTRHITNIGKGPDNDNQIYINNKRVFPNKVSDNGDQEPSVIRESVPSANSDVKLQQNQGWDPNNNSNKPNGVNRIHVPGQQTPTVHGYTRNNDNTHNYYRGKINYDEDVQNTKALGRLSSVISDVSRYANDFGNGNQNNNRIIINGKTVDPNAVSNNLNIPNKLRGYKTGEEKTHPRRRMPVKSL